MVGNATRGRSSDKFPSCQRVFFFSPLEKLSDTWMWMNVFTVHCNVLGTGRASGSTEVLTEIDDELLFICGSMSICFWCSVVAHCRQNWGVRTASVISLLMSRTGNLPHLQSTSHFLYRFFITDCREAGVHLGYWSPIHQRANTDGQSLTLIFTPTANLTNVTSGLKSHVFGL